MILKTPNSLIFPWISLDFHGFRGFWDVLEFLDFSWFSLDSSIFLRFPWFSLDLDVLISRDFWWFLMIFLLFFVVFPGFCSFFRDFVHFSVIFCDILCSFCMKLSFIYVLFVVSDDFMMIFLYFLLFCVLFVLLLRLCTFEDLEYMNEMTLRWFCVYKIIHFVPFWCFCCYFWWFIVFL